MQCLNDDEIEVCFSALVALEQITLNGDTAVIDALQDIIKDREQPGDIQDKARDVLNKIKNAGEP